MTGLRGGSIGAPKETFGEVVTGFTGGVPQRGAQKEGVRRTARSRGQLDTLVGCSPLPQLDRSPSTQLRRGRGPCMGGRQKELDFTEDTIQRRSQRRGCHCNQQEELRQALSKRRLDKAWWQRAPLMRVWQQRHLLETESGRAKQTG
jgi:hypothetical protein